MNTITESVGALKNQNYAVDKWNHILLYLFQKKMDCQLRSQWELMVVTNTDPSVEDFIIFLMKFGHAASTGQSGTGREKVLKLPRNKTTTLNVAMPEKCEVKNQFKCQVCKAQPGHLLIHCNSFKGKTSSQYYQTIKDLKRCS